MHATRSVPVSETAPVSERHYQLERLNRSYRQSDIIIPPLARAALTLEAECFTGPGTSVNTLDPGFEEPFDHESDESFTAVRYLEKGRRRNY